MTDKVSLIKPNGDRRQGIPASVQRNVIFVEDASIVIEPGDQIERVASNGLHELFEVIDPGFNERFGSIKAHYQIRFKRVETRSPSVSTDSAPKQVAAKPGDTSERFFPARSEHDAYVRLRDILQEAQRSLTIVDPYVDTTLVTLLTACTHPLEIKILTARPPSDFSLETAKFARQHAPTTIEVRSTTEFHDRFIVLDDERCFHVGASIKDAGLRAFMISEVEDRNNVEALLEQIQRSWKGAATP